MTDATRRLRERPLSPFLQVWRWHATMLCSILHRVSGVGLYIGALIFAGWAIALARGPEAYDFYLGLLGSIPGQALLILLTAGVCYHTANGVRHLVWDTGHGLDLRSANASALFVLGFTAVATIAFWALIWLEIL
ncbi:MAG TPA: succinate dehydrogenase, cytochrome b556 subunit [Phenylobacterium sp.]